MDPRDFHTLAAVLASGTSAAEFRSAISRAYYAAFNVAADHLLAIGVRLSKGAAARGEVLRCLANSGDAQLSAVSSDVDDLHSVRNRADYRLDKRDIETVSTAQATVALAKSVIDKLDRTFAGTQRAYLQATILQWRRANGYP